MVIEVLLFLPSYAKFTKSELGLKIVVVNVSSLSYLFFLETLHYNIKESQLGKGHTLMENCKTIGGLTIVVVLYYHFPLLYLILVCSDVNAFDVSDNL